MSFGAQVWAGFGLNKQAGIEGGIKLFAYNYDFVSGDFIWIQGIGASLNIKNTGFFAAGFLQEGEGSLTRWVSAWAHLEAPTMNHSVVNSDLARSLLRHTQPDNSHSSNVTLSQ